MQSVSPLIAWFFTLILILLAGRAAARLLLARGNAGARRPTPAERNRELGHVAMGLGMAVLLVPGLPRPPQSVSVGFFSVLTALAAADCGRRWWAGRSGRTTASCGVPDGWRLLDPHHALVGLAMVVMLLQPAGSASADGATTASMPGMAMGGSASTTTLLLLGYVWIAALVLGCGMTRVLAAPPQYAAQQSSDTHALLASPATVYGCELAMTVLTGLMLLN